MAHMNIVLFYAVSWCIECIQMGYFRSKPLDAIYYRAEKTNENSLIKNTKSFRCIGSYRVLGEPGNDCDGIFKGGKVEPWYAKKGKENESYIDIDFFRTIHLSKIELQHVEIGWLNKLV